MGALSSILRLLAAAALGVSAGAILTGAVILVPFWQAVPPADVLTWFAANAQRMLYFYGPLQSAGALLAVGVAVAVILGGSSNRLSAIVAAVLALAVFVPYFLYFQHANASFANATITVADVPRELTRYAQWQWSRTGLSLAAFVASLLALRRN